jgi:hypothetical protein
MLWLVAGLFVLGALCGATIRLMIFIGALIAAAAISLAFTIGEDVAAMALTVIAAAVTLQVGYVAGLVLRAAVRAYYTAPTPAIRKRPTIPAPLGGGKRR